MNIQWYPGHMTKAKRAMKEDIKLIDLIIELVDARAPLSSRNPDIDELGQGKGRLILLNKADLADEAVSALWKAYFEEKGFEVMKLDARSKAGLAKLQPLIQKACREKLERDKRRGILNRPVRAMVVGIPNVGKSTFINSLAGRAAAKTGNRPGVTKGNQWIRLNKQVELLDTPGILWPKFEDQTVGLRLAFLGSIHDEILNLDELAAELSRYLLEEKPGLLAGYYGITEEGRPVHEVLEELARVRSCLKKGGELDCMRAARLLLDDFRAGRLGRVTLEAPKEKAGDGGARDGGCT
ncbi:MAG: ribosome biogenesis GTPase YlqF [Lachnospiraceae bacterium]|jgi:ribosome biogenesis GTPase A|nr:ribosome biogenesis GTPase YlqF [Lachnospiraceae bacterium]